MMLIDVRQYSNYDWHRKLFVLVSATGADTKVIASILDLSTANVGDLLVSGIINDSVENNAHLFDRADTFLSVLAYLARLGEYDTAQIRTLWTLKGLFKESLKPPPWDKMGMESYLLENSSGLNDALIWIRSN